MKVRIYETDFEADPPSREAGTLELEHGQVVVRPATPDDTVLMTNILNSPLWVLIEGEMRTLTAKDHPEAFLQWIHREYTGSALRASRVEE